ncbi:MAG: molybdenum ABC transporter ATP-binding protein [Telmatospirillum sp.]|nr:molybdenum ABC transporter ATP-binding protein [Telmatospirillum sp.]
MLDIRLTHRQGAFGLDVAFESGDAMVTALFGPSGSGKTSVINMVAGLVRPDRGRILIDGRVLFDSADGTDLAPARRRVGYVFQEGRLFPHYSVRGNLTYGMRLTPPAERFVRFDEVVDVLGIGPLLERRPASLSGGEKQRVAIGRALLASPRLLLMDEPLAALDGPRKAELLPFIALLPRRFGVPILYVSHAIGEVLRLADRLVLMDAGRSVASGPVEEVMAGPAFAALSGESAVANVVATRVAGHDRADGVTRLAFAGGEIRVPLIEAPEGAALRVRIDAGDVMLSLARPVGLSVRNILPARVRELRPDGGMVDVILDVGSSGPAATVCPLHARISVQACRDLDPAVGRDLFALIKSAAISRADIALHEPAGRIS